QTQCNLSPVLFHQVKIWFQNRRMKWKRSRKAKEQAALTSPLTDVERNGMDIHSAKPQGDSHSSSLEDEEEDVDIRTLGWLWTLITSTATYLDI
uniref:Homeobox domain-containing protein n=1 Tax=Lates calcarifer TaxID=8187 RepID=A0A4W6G6S1_LATCA